MAFIDSTSDQRVELLRQLNILAKDTYAALTEFKAIDQTGPAIDAKIPALEAAIAAVKAAA